MLRTRTLFTQFCVAWLNFRYFAGSVQVYTFCAHKSVPNPGSWKLKKNFRSFQWTLRVAIHRKEKYIWWTLALSEIRVLPRPSLGRWMNNDKFGRLFVCLSPTQNATNCFKWMIFQTYCNQRKRPKNPQNLLMNICKNVKIFFLLVFCKAVDLSAIKVVK